MASVMLADDHIHLIGPGGAGKSTAGFALAERLQLPFLDLDTEFMKLAGDISGFIDRQGYEAYALKNVETYLALLAARATRIVFALSSGFMTYPDGIHPAYAQIRSSINASSFSFVLMPSFDLEMCVSEIVRRQLMRSFARSPEREEAVIRERFNAYMALRANKVETMSPLAKIVDEIAAVLGTTRK